MLRPKNESFDKFSCFYDDNYSCCWQVTIIFAKNKIYLIINLIQIIMKKIFTLIAAVAFAASASAQVLSFDTKYDKGAVPASFSNGDLVLSVTDTDGKLAVEANSASFGTPDSYVSFDYCLKTGGKSSKKNGLTLTLPVDGILKVYARTGSNDATDRNVILTQNETVLVNKVLLESEAVKATIGEVEKNVYPVISVEAKKGDVAVTYPINSVKFYAFELVNAAGVSTILTPKADGKTFNLAGVQVSENAKGLKIKNGKKYVK